MSRAIFTVDSPIDQRHPRHNSSRRCDRGDGRPVAGYWNSAEHQLRDEGRRDLKEVSRRDSKKRGQVGESESD